MTKNTFHKYVDKRVVAILKNRSGDYCVIITSRATNQSREFSFFTYVITLIILIDDISRCLLHVFPL